MSNQIQNPLQGAQILLVDDHPANLDVLCAMLEGQGYRIAIAPSGHIALRLAKESPPDLILLDVIMPQLDGYQTCRQLKAEPDTSAIPIIFITGRDLKEDILAGFRAGGVDYITKPFQEEEVLVRVQTHLHISRLSHQLENKNDQLAAKNQELLENNQRLEEEMARRKALKNQLSLVSQREAAAWGLEGFVGHSPTIQLIFQDIRLMQENAATSVLITGESGTGKELIGRAIHFGSSRQQGPFVPVNCAALPHELAESLLFGHVKGAFTGANTDRAGYFEMAHEGTLFLDEMGEMPLELQAKLLRVLEDGEVRRVGAVAGRQVDVRVLAATNIDLQTRINDGRFRQDLYFRLARFTVTAPPLRQRRDDIPLLAQHFLQLFAGEMNLDAPDLDPAVIEQLQAYTFPGNVRELKNIIERALIESRGQPIQPHNLHFLDQTKPQSTEEAPLLELPLDLDQAVEEAEKWVVQSALARAKGNVSEAARLLGTNRSRLYRVLNQ